MAIYNPGVNPWKPGTQTGGATTPVLPDGTDTNKKDNNVAGFDYAGYTSGKYTQSGMNLDPINKKLETVWGQSNPSNNVKPGDFGRADAMNNFDRYDPTKQGSQTKSAFFDALNLQGSAAHGTDKAMDQISRTASMDQKATQGADKQAMMQQAAQLGMSKSQILMQQQMANRTQEAAQTDLLGQLAVQRAERQAVATKDLASMALSGRSMEQAEEKMQLEDKWFERAKLLEQQGMNIDAAYKERALELQQRGFGLEVIDRMLTEEFGKSDQDLNWAKLMLQDEQFLAQHDLSKEQLEAQMKDIDSQIAQRRSVTVAQNMENFTESLKYLDLTSEEGVTKAQELFAGINGFGTDEASKAELETWWKSLDFTDLRLMEFDSKRDDSLANMGEYISAFGADQFMDDKSTGGKELNFFKQGEATKNGGLEFKDKGMELNALSAYWYANGGEVGQYKDQAEFINAWQNGTVDASITESMKGYVNGKAKEFVMTANEVSYNDSMNELYRQLGDGKISQADFNTAEKALNMLQTYGITGGVTAVIVGDNIVLKDGQGNVVYDPSGKSTGTTNTTGTTGTGQIVVSNGDGTSVKVTNKDGVYIADTVSDAVTGDDVAKATTLGSMFTSKYTPSRPDETPIYNVGFKVNEDGGWSTVFYDKATGAEISVSQAFNNNLVTDGKTSTGEGIARAKFNKPENFKGFAEAKADYEASNGTPKGKGEGDFFVYDGKPYTVDATGKKTAIDYTTLDDAGWNKLLATPQLNLTDTGAISTLKDKVKESPTFLDDTTWKTMNASVRGQLLESMPATNYERNTDTRTGNRKDYPIGLKGIGKGSTFKDSSGDLLRCVDTVKSGGKPWAYSYTVVDVVTGEKYVYNAGQNTWS